MKRYLILIALLCLVGSIHAQNNTIIQGVVKNEKGQPVENVSVYIQDSLLVSITDEQGNFAYPRAAKGDRLRFAHVGYEPKNYTIQGKDLDGQPINIGLKTKSHELLEVEVTANAPHIAFDNPVRSVLDYVIADDGIYLLAYRSRNTSVLHLSFEMDTLHELILSSAYKNLYKDFYGFVHVVSDENACQLSFTMTTDGRKKDMFLCAPLSLNLFYKNYAPIVAASDSVVITGRYAFYGTEQYYYCVTPTADTMYLLEHIVDEKMRDDIIDLYRFGVDKFIFMCSTSIRPYFTFTTQSMVSTISFTSLLTPMTRPLFTMPLARNWSAIRSFIMSKPDGMVLRYRIDVGRRPARPNLFLTSAAILLPR